METTLEVRWFIKGTPSAQIERWFKLECPGELLAPEPESREDWYSWQNREDMAKFKLIFPHINNREAINLKLREGNLELKLRQQKLGTQTFSNLKDSVVWTGNLEQWHKLSQAELTDSGLLHFPSIFQGDWISVDKKRVQKIEQDVKSELTWLKSDRTFWWSIAFEMTQDSHNKQQDRHFQKVIEQSCQSYWGCKLVAQNSYSYSHWLLLLNK